MKREMKLQSIDFMECLNWSSENPLDAQFQEERLSIEPPLFPSTETKKRSYKNKYVKKLKQSCAGLSTSARNQLNGSEHDPNIDQRAQKKLKNKIAAKESRDRKKKYIQIIEAQTHELQEQLSKINKQLEQNKAQIIRVTYNPNQNVTRLGGSFSAKAEHVIKKLRKLIREEEGEERNNQLNLSIDSVCYRFAATGKERRTNINDCYRQILNLGIPPAHRYLMWTSRQNAHIFGDQDCAIDETEEWFGEMKNMLGNAFQESNLTPAYKTEVNKIGQQLLPLIIKLFQKKSQIENLCSEVDQLFLDIRNIFTPQQFAKFVLFEQVIRYKDQIRYYQRICLPDSIEEKLGQPRKITKLDSN